MAEKHSATPPRFECATCGTAFRRRSNLDVHVEIKHSAASARFPCVLCGTAFTRQRDLNAHLKTKHRADCDAPLAEWLADVENSVPRVNDDDELGGLEFEAFA